MNKKIISFLKNPGLLIMSLGHRGMFKWIPDETYLKIIYRVKMGKKLNLNPPVTFNEKIQWLKLHDRKPEYTLMVDKYEAKKYVANIIGKQYIIPTLGVWNHFDEIDFGSLPNQFVLKCTHDSGGLVICKDKKSFNINAARRKITNCLKHNFFWGQREWPYKNVKPRIIAEKYMEDSTTKELRDYKIFTFDGVAKALFIATDRQEKNEETKFDFFDAEFKHLPFTNGHPNADVAPSQPVCFEEMKQLAEKLSQKIPHVRVDFYEVNGKVFFGELTFSHWSGLMPFKPETWDKQFGEWIKLPENYGGGYYLTGNNYALWLHQMKQEGLVDYKFFCFNGEPCLLYVSKGLDYHPTAEISFYDMNGNEEWFHRSDYNPFHNATIPVNFDEMRDIASTVSKKVGCPFVRVDLYSVNNKVYFSEITFSPCSGMVPFEPSSADLKLGQSLKLQA